MVDTHSHQRFTWGNGSKGIVPINENKRHGFFQEYVKWKYDFSRIIIEK